MTPIQLSIIIPAKEEEESLPLLCQWITRVLDENNFIFEVILIDDGSTDGTWQEMMKIHSLDGRYKALRFNRNFGKSAALQTGFRLAQGEVIVTMDADLQDSPEEIPALFKLIHSEKYDLVSGWKKKRHDPLSKTLPSKFFNFLTRKISGINLHDFNCGLKAYRNTVVKNITVYGEMHRYIPVIAKWAGFSRITEKVVDHQERKFGYSKFGWGRMRGMFDLLSITFMGRFGKKPMHFFGTLGVISFLLGFLFTLKMFWDKLNSLYFSQVPLKRDITQQPLFFLSLVALIIGVQLFVTGFLAEMLATRSHSKRDYLIIESVGLPDTKKAKTQEP